MSLLWTTNSYRYNSVLQNDYKGVSSYLPWSTNNYCHCYARVSITISPPLLLKTCVHPSLIQKQTVILKIRIWKCGQWTTKSLSWSKPPSFLKGFQKTSCLNYSFPFFSFSTWRVVLNLCLAGLIPMLPTWLGVCWIGSIWWGATGCRSLELFCYTAESSAHNFGGTWLVGCGRCRILCPWLLDISLLETNYS